MQIVIDIPEELKNKIDNANEDNYKTYLWWFETTLYCAIKNGTPLPKGHGRIMDVDKVIKKMEEREERLKDDRSIWETACVETALDMFGETIIEADSEKE